MRPSGDRVEVVKVVKLPADSNAAKLVRRRTLPKKPPSQQLAKPSAKHFIPKITIHNHDDEEDEESKKDYDKSP